MRQFLYNHDLKVVAILAIQIIIEPDFSNKVIEAAAESLRAEFVIEEIPGKPIEITDVIFLKEFDELCKIIGEVVEKTNKQ
jgi:hypothetical protein